MLQLCQRQATDIKAGFHRRRSRSRKSASDLMKIENRSRKRSVKPDGIGVRRIKTVPFSSDSVYDFDAYDPVTTRLSQSKQKRKNQPITMLVLRRPEYSLIPKSSTI